MDGAFHLALTNLGSGANTATDIATRGGGLFLSGVVPETTGEEMASRYKNRFADVLLWLSCASLSSWTPVIVFEQSGHMNTHTHTHTQVADGSHDSCALQSRITRCDCHCAALSRWVRPKDGR